MSDEPEALATPYPVTDGLAATDVRLIGLLPNGDAVTVARTDEGDDIWTLNLSMPVRLALVKDHEALTPHLISSGMFTSSNGEKCCLLLDDETSKEARLNQLGYIPINLLVGAMLALGKYAPGDRVQLMVRRLHRD